MDDKSQNRIRPNDDVIANLPKTRIELHAHLDGCMRYSTMFDLLKEKRAKLPGNTLEDFKKAVTVRDPVDLNHFLGPFNLFLSAVQDDFEALERIAFEFAEDKALQNALYVETRYSPHSFLSRKNSDLANLSEVITCIYKGFQKAEQEFGIKCRSILCTLVGKTTAKEVLDVYQQNRSKGLVGIDLATKFDEATVSEEVPLIAEEFQVFQEAKKLGIHRTVHAGERGSAEMVRRAVEVYAAERIGHGYRVLEDKYIFRSCLTKNIHFECCPWSSFLTGSVSLNVKKHPIAIFAAEGASFSINSDDTAVTGYDLNDEYALTQKWGFNEGLQVRCNFNALQASFLPANEKKSLLKQLKTNLGIP